MIQIASLARTFFSATTFCNQLAGKLGDFTKSLVLRITVVCRAKWETEKKKVELDGVVCVPKSKGHVPRTLLHFRKQRLSMLSSTFGEKMTLITALC